MSNRFSRILIVDDEPKNIRMIQTMLAPEGYILQSATSGREALSIVAESPPDLILLDALMPEMNGFQVARQLKLNSETTSIPVVMVSALDDRQSGMLGLNAGAIDFLSKPVDRFELSMRIRNLLRLKEYSDIVSNNNRLLTQQVNDQKVLLTHAEQRFREFADSIPHILWTAKPDGSLDYLNQVYTDCTGVTLDDTGDSWLAALHPDDVERCVAAWDESVSTGNVYDIEFRVIHVDSGEYHWYAVTAKPVMDAAGKIVKWYGIATNIHERKIADQRAQSLAHRLNTTLENMSDGFVLLDQDWHVSYMNGMAERMLKKPRSSVLGKVVWDEFPELVESRIYRECQRAVATASAVESEFFSPLVDRWFEVKVYPSEDGVSVYVRDITERKNAESEILRLAFYDQLTGLPNRQLLRDRLQRAMLKSKRTHRMGAVMFVDLDNFKLLNDTQGHQKGDVLLQESARRLTACVREIDTVARLGGDEFVVLVEELSDDAIEAATQAESIGEKILSALGQPCEVGGFQHTSTASIGITLLDSQVSSIDELLKRADLAMYRAKAAGRNTARFYDPAMQDAVSTIVALETGLRESIQNNMFVLHYQPQLNNQGQAIGAEALLRWTHPAYKNVPPNVFIPVAEDCGLIIHLGHWVLEAACAQLVKWAQAPHTAQLTLAVNVSARQFHQPEFVSDVLDTVRRSGANPEMLKLELTETVLVKDIEDAVTKISALKEHGIRFSLDDFGTGYSSLSYLRYLPLEQLKLDRSFIGRIPDNATDAAIVQAIIAMGHNLGLTIIAEGVETEPQLEFLSRHGCNAYQGFLFSKPVIIDEFMMYIQNGKDAR
ncbi:EAL domain-containing protein [Herbaspirillum sp. GCM10030257]|uniref:EAL domain-containing protein n=1 Tax=Herbaspirillum sp. GCM10030257 TaxID=3273393 RepID=UPI00361F4D62